MNFYWLTYFEYRTLSVFYFVRLYSCLDTNYNEHPHTFRIISYVLFNKAASKCFLFLDCLCYFLSFNNNNIYLPTAAVSPFTFSETLACEGRISEICRWYIRETECAWILECDSCNCRKTILSGLRCKIVNSATIYTRCLSVKCPSETFILRFNHFRSTTTTVRLSAYDVIMQMVYSLIFCTTASRRVCIWLTEKA